MVTDPDSGAIWYLGGTLGDGSTATNELDKFQDGAWTAAIATSAPAGTSSSSTLNSFSQGTTHIYNGKIYIFGGITSAGGQRGYQSFQNLPWIDVSGDTPTVGSQVDILFGETIGTPTQTLMSAMETMTIRVINPLIVMFIFDS